MSEKEMDVAEAGQVVEIEARSGFVHSVTVSPPCENGERGHWYCALHNEGFSNNLQAQGHRWEKGKHLFTWMCWDHGAEAPAD